MLPRLLLVFYALISLQAYGEVLMLTEKGQYDPNPYISYLATDNKDLTLADIIQPDSELTWIKNGNETLNFGFSEDIYWLKMEVMNQSHINEDWAVELSYAQLDKVDIYVLHGDEVEEYYFGGDQIPFSRKIVKHPQIIFPLKIHTNHKHTIYIRINTVGAVQAPITIWRWDEFNHKTLIHFMSQGIFIGFIIIMVLYNLMLWALKKEAIYLNYVIYISSLALFQSTLSGIGFHFLWPEAPWINEFISATSLSTSMAFLNLFIVKFFDTKNNNPKMHTILTANITIFCIVGLLSLLIPYYIAIVSVAILTVYACSFIIFVSIYMLYMNHSSARYFAISWCVLLSGSLLLALNKFGLIPVTPISEYTLQIGVGLEVMFLSLGLADRMANSQNEALSLATQVNEEREKTFQAELENLRIEKEANSQLENLVDERTKDLTNALNHLSIAHDKLQTISITDALTDLHNRYYFNEHFRIEYKRAHREKTECSLILLDVDHFKIVNDTYGHPAGDACLVHIARCIKRHAAREQDICCRYGGEEFAIILPATSSVGAYDVAEDIRQEIEDSVIEWEGKQMTLTVSLGISSKKPSHIDAKNRQYLINQADRALYDAKHQGRNIAVLFDHDVY